MAATLQSPCPGVPRGMRRGFTLVELLVSMVVLLILLLVLVQMTNQTTQIWRSSRSRIDDFQSARNAFERITSHLSQATLNTYLDYYNSNGQSRTDVLRGSSTSAASTISFTPTTYDRASDLQFVCDQANTLVPPPAGGSRPTHAMFFLAPLGYVTSTNTANTDFTSLHNVLNGVGYYIDFADTSTSQPAFMTSKTPKWRYRLMELYQPSQNLSIYFLSPSAAYSGTTSWFYGALNPPNGAATPTVITSENIVALIVRPESATTSAAANVNSTTTVVEIAPQYTYDTKAYAPPTSQTDAFSKLSKNQLPPLVQVTMVAIDANSATRLAAQFGTSAPPLYNNAPFNEVTAYNADMTQLETNLQNYHLNYRVFTFEVGVLGAQWSQGQ